MYAAVNMELGVRGTEALKRSYRTYDRRSEWAMRDVVRRGAALVRTITMELAPVHSGKMREDVKIKITDKGFAYEVGWYVEDYLSEGMAFYPWYQEFGTFKMAAQPSLRPAFRYSEPIILADMRDTQRRILEHMNRTTGRIR